MRLKLWIVLALAVVAACVAAGCGGDDDEGEDERAQDYGLQVERISDEAYHAAQSGLLTLNKLSDGSVRAQDAITALERSSQDITADRAKLEDLSPPESGAAVADDLAFQFDSLARSLDEAAATVSSAGADVAELRETGRSFARVVLAYQSGSTALSRALRTSVVDAED